MDKKEYIEKVLSLLPPFDKNDKESVIRGITQAFNWGFTINDARKWNYYTEEVSPQFSEEFALARMRQISDKYNIGRKGKGKG